MNKILKMMLNFYGTILSSNITNEPAHDKTNIMTCAPSEDSDQPVHPPTPHPHPAHTPTRNKQSLIFQVINLLFMDNTVRSIEQPLELCSLMHELFMTMGAIELKVDVQYIHSGINIVKFSDNSLFY